MLASACAAVPPGPDGWRVDVPDERTTVGWRIREIADERGKATLRIEDWVETTVPGTLEAAVAVLLDVPGHVTFNGAAESRVVEKIASERWLVYAFIDKPWPVTNCDRISELSYVRDGSARSARFRFVAVPEAYPRGDVPR